MVRSTKLWSDLPSGEVAIYASFTLAYSRSRVFSLVLQVTYWVNFRIVFLMKTLLKSPETIMRALERAVCSLAIVEWVTSPAVGLADGGIYTATALACENSRGK